MHITSFHIRTAAILFAAALISVFSKSSLADDLFVGKFASETRENFGRDKYAEYEIEVVRKGDKHVLSIFQDGNFKYDIEAVPCDPNNEGYLREHPPGEVYALCNLSYKSPVLVYSQNGIKDPMAEIYRQKDLKNPRTDLYYKARFYAHIQWGFYGFRKVR